MAAKVGKAINMFRNSEEKTESSISCIVDGGGRRIDLRTHGLGEGDGAPVEETTLSGKEE